MTHTSPATGKRRRLAVVLGVTPPSDGQARPGLDEYRHLAHAETHAAALAAVLHEGFGYELVAPAGRAPATATEVEQMVGRALRESQDAPIVLVHLLAHAEWQDGSYGDRGHLYLIGPDRQRVATPVDGWLVRAQTQRPGVGQALFVVDCCESGRLVELPHEESLEVRDRRQWVIAACKPRQLAYDNRLTLAFTEVLRAFADQRELVDSRVPHISLDVVARLVERLVDEAALAAEAAGYPSSQQIHVTRAPICTDLRRLEFFPNPRYRPPVGDLLLDGLAPPTRHMVEQIVDSDYFQGLASGMRGPVPGARFAFQGRASELNMLRAWADGQQPALRVVTGKPGVGKSALLGVVVCAALPKLRDAAEKKLGYLAALPPVIPDLAVVHARSQVLAQVVDAVAYQWQLDRADHEGPWTVEELIEAIQDRLRPPTLIVDALDEAQRPEDLLAALILPLATAVRPGDGSPACRLLVGVRPDEERFGPLLARAREAGGYLDLGSAPAEGLREDLRRYVQVLLMSGKGWPHGSTTLADRFAEEVAGTLTAAGGEQATAPACGEYLIAGLYVRHLLRHPAPPATAEEVREFVAALPLDIPGILDLDLDRPEGGPWTRSVAAALAFAEGTGMPERVVRLAAGAFPPLALAPPVAGTSSMDGPSIEDVRQALQDLRVYLRHDVDVDGTTLYRLYHDGLTDVLRRDPFGSAALAGGAR